VLSGEWGRGHTVSETVVGALRNDLKVLGRRAYLIGIMS
jgi:hypothetical protein